MPLALLDPTQTCSTTAGFRFVVAGGWHSAFSGVLASIVFVAIVFVLTNSPEAEEHQHERGPSLRILFVTFFVFLVASFLWATVAGFSSTIVDGSGRRVASALQPVLGVPAAWLLSIGAVLLFFAVCWLVAAYEGHRNLATNVARTARRCFRLIAWLTAVELWIAIETATRAVAGRGWWYDTITVAIVTVISIPFLFADRVIDRFPSRATPPGRGDRRIRDALAFVGTCATIMVVGFAAVTGQPDSALLHEGRWCGDGLPPGAAAAAVVVMTLYLCSIAALARALPRASEAVEPSTRAPGGSATLRP
jgi:hypothetical protein